MGNKLSYCERRCQICAVSFRVNRIPTPHEQEAQGWDNGGEVGGDNGAPRTQEEGYDGSAISAAEMKGINNLRCLLQKPANFTPEKSDEGFEKDSTCFLTDIAVHQGPHMYNSGPFRTARHGVTEAKITNDNDCFGGVWGMPFHPACFEIFKRVCLKTLGFVDIDGLWRVRDLRGSYEYSVGGSDRPLSVRQYASDDEGWHHKPGTEYLAANPVDIPGFRELARHYMDTSREQDQYNPPSPHSKPDQNIGCPGVDFNAETDLFRMLPNELLTEILWYLSSRDIANLRLATRSYRSLPDILFKHLIRTEMPYLWEIDELRSNCTDWAQLYTRSKVDWKNNILGLRNRARIWNEVEGIVEMIRETNHGLIH